MQKYMDDENLMPKEQKGCFSGSKGCKDQLLIFYKNVNAGKKNCIWHGLIIRKLSTGCHTVGLSNP
jgi:hypothetical protein